MCVISTFPTISEKMNTQKTWVCLKTEFNNAFHSLSREVMRQELFKIKKLAPIFPLGRFLYSQPSLLKGLLRDVFVRAVGGSAPWRHLRLRPLLQRGAVLLPTSHAQLGLTRAAHLQWCRDLDLTRS